STQSPLSPQRMLPLRTLRALRSIRCGVVLGQVFWVAPITKKIAHHRGFGRIIVFGPQTFQRATGNPVTVTRTFAITGPLDGYTLRVVNRGVTSAVIALNARAVLNPSISRAVRAKTRRRIRRAIRTGTTKTLTKAKTRDATI